MNKATFIATVAEKTNMPKAQVERVLDAIQDVIIDTVAGGDDIKLTGFAAFVPASRAARTMKNPRTGEDIKVPETKVVRIRPLKRFKDAVSGE